MVKLTYCMLEWNLKRNVAFRPAFTGLDHASVTCGLTQTPAEGSGCRRGVSLTTIHGGAPLFDGHATGNHQCAVSILGFENCQSFFSYNCPCTYGVPQCAARGAPQCAERISLIGTTLAKLSKQLRNITYRQLF